MMLSPLAVSLEIFSWDRENNMLVTDASTMHIRPSRVYDDACDVGFSIVSHHTGRVVIYSDEKYFEDTEGDLVYTDYTPVLEKDSHLPTVRVFNT